MCSSVPARRTSAPASAPRAQSRRRRGARRARCSSRAARAPAIAPPDRHRRLADAERDARRRREPAHDRSAAARLTLAARDPGEPEQDDEPASSARTRGGEEGCAQAEPAASVQRSPKRSTAKPHGRSANVSPIHSAARTTPISVRPARTPRAARARARRSRTRRSRTTRDGARQHRPADSAQGLEAEGVDRASRC